VTCESSDRDSGQPVYYSSCHIANPVKVTAYICDFNSTYFVQVIQAEIDRELCTMDLMAMLVRWKMTDDVTQHRVHLLPSSSQIHFLSAPASPRHPTLYSSTITMPEKERHILPHALKTPAIKKLSGKRIVLASASPRRKEILERFVSTPLSICLSYHPRGFCKQIARMYLGQDTDWIRSQ
jgi:hypothetical protein